MNKLFNFLGSNGGKTLLTVIFCIIIWGLIALFLSSDNIFLLMLALLTCVFFGWKALSRFQTPMFFRTWKGMGIYLLIKFFISGMIGIFVAPFVIGKWLSEKASDIL